MATTTYEYRIKCNNCSLHYVVFSWDENWANTPGQGRNGGICPECGIRGAKMIWGPRDVGGFIFERVAGDFEQEQLSLYPAPAPGYGLGATASTREENA
jgi:hypothetical protein